MAASVTFTTPNLYQLRGAGIHVTYSTGGFGSRLNLTYQDANGSQSFSDGQITVTQTPIGGVVTVTIRRTVDTGSTSFSVLIPTVNLVGPGQAAPDLHRGDHHPPPLLGHSGLRSGPRRALPGHAAERDGGAGLVLQFDFEPLLKCSVRMFLGMAFSVGLLLGGRANAAPLAVDELGLIASRAASCRAWISLTRCDDWTRNSLLRGTGR